jgi:hypothetical protein
MAYFELLDLHLSRGFEEINAEPQLGHQVLNLEYLEYDEGWGISMYLRF